MKNFKKQSLRSAVQSVGLALTVSLLFATTGALAQTAATPLAASAAASAVIQGFSSERLARIAPSMQEQVRLGMFPGAVTMVARNGVVVHNEAHGFLDAAKSKPREGTSATQRPFTRERYPMPDFLLKSLKAHKLLAAYEARPPYQRNDYIGWITRAKLEATRSKRLNQMLAELASGREYMGMAYKVEK